MKINKQEAIKALLNNQVVCIETDTVPGLATLPTNQEALYKLKRRSKEKKIIFLIDDIKRIPDLDKEHQKLLKNYWPGAVSFIIDNQGYRIPNCSDCIEVISACGGVLAVSSANISGMNPILNYEELQKYFPSINYLETTGKKSSVPSQIYSLDKNNNSLERLR